MSDDRFPNPETLDVFRGSERLKSLSSALVRGLSVSDDEIAAALSPGSVRPFRIAQKLLAGARRRVVGEPSLAHSGDVAARAADLGYPHPVIACCLLHDVIEDACTTLAELASAVHRLESEVGSEIARDVCLLSNRYDIILGELASQMPEALGFSSESLPPVRAALDRYEQALPLDVRTEFAHELAQVRWWLGDAAQGVRWTGVDHDRSLMTELKRQIYGLYIQDLVDATRVRLERPSEVVPEALLVCKSLDLIDNLRTLEISVRSLRGMWKVEQALDRSYFLHGHAAQASTDCTLIPLYDSLKASLVQQLDERRCALGSLSDSRFEPLALLLASEIRRLQDKYKVADPLRALGELRDEIRRRNQVAAALDRHGDAADGTSPGGLR